MQNGSEEMSEIVFYDANPTVRSLLTKHFKTYGLRVVQLTDLDSCETVLKQCRDPLVIVLDMSREPEALVKLQQIVPEYIRESERCILTSISPTALAAYLPKDISTCFFSHVVERPFKKKDFLQFFDEVIQPCLAKATYSQELSASNINSSVLQITGPSYLEQVDEGLRKQIENIVQNTSSCTDLEPGVEVSKSDEVSGPSESVGDSMNRSGRSENIRISRRNRMQLPKHAEEANVLAKTRALILDNGAVPEPSGQALGSMRRVGMASVNKGRVSALRPALERENRRDLVSEETEARGKEDVRQPSVVKEVSAEAVLSDGKAEVKEPECVASGSVKEEKREIDAVGVSSCQVPMTLIFNFYWFLSILSRSLANNFYNTIVCHGMECDLIILLRCGRLLWIDSLKKGECIQDVSSFLSDHALTLSKKPEEYIKQYYECHSLAKVFSSLKVDVEAYAISEQQILTYLPMLRTMEGRSVDYYEYIPEQYQQLLHERPCNSIDIFPALFEDFRCNADLVLAPPYFQVARYYMRPYKTPLNGAINLNTEERELLGLLAQPKTIQELKRAGKKHVSDIMYRLVLFEFADFVY